MKTYLYICSHCGYDIAAYESLAKCLNCRAGRDNLRIIGTSDDPDLAEKLRLAHAQVHVLSRQKRVNA